MMDDRPNDEHARALPTTAEPEQRGAPPLDMGQPSLADAPTMPQPAHLYPPLPDDAPAFDEASTISGGAPEREADGVRFAFGAHVDPRSVLARPFPYWLIALVPAGALLLLALVYSLAEVLAHADWADGARAAAYTGFALATLVVLGTAARVALGRRVILMLLLGAALVAGLLGTSLTALALGPTLRAAQARELERAGQWDGAIQEYTLAGETGPAAANIARIFNESGEALLAAHDYAGAAVRFTTVTTNYNATGAEVARARADLLRTYTGWVKAGGNDIPYDTALSFLDDYAKEGACDTSCRAQVSALEAQAHYQYGVLLADKQAGRYADGVKQFETVQKQFASSPYAPQAHKAAATAYLALGQQQLKQTCATALPTYQTLVTSYADTAEGKTAGDALKAPQTVSGTFTNAPTNPSPTVFLSRSANTNIPSFSDDYQTSVDASSGAYTFKDIPPGDYYLSMIRDLGPGGTDLTWAKGQDGAAATFHVGPLCPTSLQALAFP
jgi:tetratricopeptide (TPR) repeat protein